MNMKVWIVCEPCEDHFYAGSPTGVVFTDKAKAEQYIAEKNGNSDDPLFDYFALYLVKGELI